MRSKSFRSKLPVPLRPGWDQAIFSKCTPSFEARHPDAVLARLVKAAIREVVRAFKHNQRVAQPRVPNLEMRSGSEYSSRTWMKR